MGGKAGAAITVRLAYDPAVAAVVLGMPDPLRADPRFIKIFEESKPLNAPEVPR